PASEKSRYVTAGVLSAVLIGWVAVAQYLGAANTYLATADTAEAGVPTIVFGLLIPLAVAAIALWRSDSIAKLVSVIPLHWLVVAITMGAMTSPGPAHLLAFETPNLLISSYPLVMVPTFAVPLALMLHGLVLWRLRRGAASAERLAAA